MNTLLPIELLTPEIYMAIFPLLERGIKYLNDGAELYEIIKDIQNKIKQLWLVKDEDKILSVIITTIIEYPHKKRLLYYLVVGENIEQWFHHYDTIAKWAKYLGCSEIELFGRKGWEKKLKHLGFKLNYVSMIAKI